MRVERVFAAMGSTAHLVVEVATAGDRSQAGVHHPADVPPLALHRPGSPAGRQPGVVDGEALVSRAEQEIARLERLWSRFRPDSDVSRINSDPGAAVTVAADTIELVARARHFCRLTAGRFDPTLLASLVAAGYDRSFDQMQMEGRVPPEGTRLDPGGSEGPPGKASVGLVGEVFTDACHDAFVTGRVSRARVGAAVAASGPGCRSGLDPADPAERKVIDDRVRVDAVRSTVTVAPGVGLDLGGIAKGWAADRVAEDLMRLGATGVCVNLGGDVRVAGEAPDPAGWVVAIADPHHPESDLTTVVVADAAVATSARTRRQWIGGGHSGHHLIDPGTGRPTAGGLAAVTVVAATAALAEVIAKAAFVAGRSEAPEVIEGLGGAALMVADDGRLTRVGAFDWLEV